MRCFQEKAVVVLRKDFSARRDSLKNFAFLCELKVGDTTLSR